VVLSPERHSAQSVRVVWTSKVTNDGLPGLAQIPHRMLYSCTYVAIVGVIIITELITDYCTTRCC